MIWRGVCTDVNISSILYPINPAFELNVGSKVYDAFEDKKALFFFFIIQSTQWQIGLFQNNVFGGRFILKGHYCVQAANNFGHYWENDIIDNVLFIT